MKKKYLNFEELMSAAYAYAESNPKEFERFAVDFGETFSDYLAKSQENDAVGFHGECINPKTNQPIIKFTLTDEHYEKCCGDVEAFTDTVINLASLLYYSLHFNLDPIEIN